MYEKQLNPNETAGVLRDRSVSITVPRLPVLSRNAHIHELTLCPFFLWESPILVSFSFRQAELGPNLPRL